MKLFGRAEVDLMVSLGQFNEVLQSIILFELNYIIGLIYIVNTTLKV